MKNLTTLKSTKLVRQFIGKADGICSILEIEGKLEDGVITADTDNGVAKYFVKNGMITSSEIIDESYHGKIVEETIDAVEESPELEEEVSPVDEIVTRPKWLKISKIITNGMANYLMSVVTSPLTPNTKKPVLAVYELTRNVRGNKFLIEKVEDGVGNTPFFSEATFEETKKLISDTHGIKYVDKTPRKLAEADTINLAMMSHVMTFLDAVGFDKSAITVGQAITIEKLFMTDAESILGEAKLGVLSAFGK